MIRAADTALIKHASGSMELTGEWGEGTMEEGS